MDWNKGEVAAETARRMNSSSPSSCAVRLLATYDHTISHSIIIGKVYLTVLANPRSGEPGLLTQPGCETMMEGDKKSKMTTSTNKTEIIPDDDVFNGCTPHDARASRFLCTKDGLYWPSLSECVINCPCKVRCNG
nr:unnamed protein product [Digitaria exilis]